MNEQDRQILEENGWEIDCESPFEISYKEDGDSQASGYAAEIILMWLKE
jgi:hypothetical protein